MSRIEGKTKILSMTSFPQVENWLKAFVDAHQSDTDKSVPKIQYYKFKKPEAIYQKALDFCFEKGINYHLVAESFPFEDESQKCNFELKKPHTPGPFKPDWLQ